MKKRWLIGGGVLAVAVMGVAVVALLCGGAVENLATVDKPVEKFPLSTEMYDGGEMVEVTAAEFGQLLAERKSFIVVVHMMLCPAEFPVTSIAKQLAHDDGLVIYGLTEEEFRQTALAEKIKYLPSVVIYHEGELVSFLDAESDADLPYYQTVEGLRKWLRRYVEL